MSIFKVVFLLAAYSCILLLKIPVFSLGCWDHLFLIWFFMWLGLKLLSSLHSVCPICCFPFLLSLSLWLIEYFSWLHLLLLCLHNKFFLELQNFLGAGYLKHFWVLLWTRIALFLNIIVSSWGSSVHLQVFPHWTTMKWFYKLQELNIMENSFLLA